MSTINSGYTSKGLINQYKRLIFLFPILTPNLKEKRPNIINTKNSRNSWMQNRAKFRAAHNDITVKVVRVWKN